MSDEFDELDEMDRLLKSAFVEPSVHTTPSIAPAVLDRLERLQRFDRLRRRILLGLTVLGALFLLSVTPLLTKTLHLLTELEPVAASPLDPVLLGGVAAACMSAVAFLSGRRVF